MDLVVTRINALAVQAESGDEHARDDLLRLAWIWVERIINSTGYFPPGGHGYDDMVQVGVLGVYEALRIWRPDGLEFSAFVRPMVIQDLKTFMTRGNRKKHRFVSDAVPLNAPAYPDEDDSPEVMEMTPDDGLCGQDPAQVVAETNEAERILAVIRGPLTPVQQRALELFLLGGLSYQETADTLGKTPKAVDCMIYKIRKVAVQHLTLAMDDPGWSDATRLLVRRMMTRDGKQFGKARRRDRVS